MSRWLLVLLVLLPMVLRAGPARAEVTEITFVRQYGIAYTPLLIMEADRLIEKHAEALGLAGFKVNWGFLTSGAAANDGLLSGRLAFGIGAPPAMLLLWDRTRGTQNAVRGVTGVAVMPTVLNTRDPAITSIRDYNSQHRIALPAVKLSNHAITLQMAAAQAFGPDSFARLDTLTVAMPHPDAAAQLMGRAASEVTSHFASPPFDVFELKSPQVHTVLNSFDVMGDASLTLIWTTERFAAANPRVVQAVFDAVAEALAAINHDKAAAADRYLALSGDKIARADLAAVFDNPRIQFDAAPRGVMAFATFMHRVGTLRAAPQGWKDVFLPLAQGLPGS